MEGPPITLTFTNRRNDLMRKRLAIIAVFALVTALASLPAEARPYAKRATSGIQTAPAFDVAAIPPYPTEAMPGAAPAGRGLRAAKRSRTAVRSRGDVNASPEPSYGEGVIGGRPPECRIVIGRRLIPYCGCAVSLKVFGKPIRELFLAANWRKFPRAAAAAGRVAWRWGHVILIEDVHGDGTVTAYDPNSGSGLTRRHRVSLRGYRVVDPRDSNVAARQ